MASSRIASWASMFTSPTPPPYSSSPRVSYSYSSTFLLSCLLTSAAAVCYVLQKPVLTKGRNMPPGPKGIPIFGNLFQLSDRVWVTFTQWKQTYGSLVYITVAGQGLLVLNTHKAASDLLDRKAGIFSERPRLIVASDILTGGLLFAVLKCNDVWRRMRRAAHETLHKGVVKDYEPIQMTEAVLLTDGMLREPENWEDHMQRTTASAIMSMVYDTPPLRSCHDPSITRINQFVDRMSDATKPGAHFVEFFTWMKYLPSSIAKWKREAEHWFRKDSEMFEGLYKNVQERILNGDERPSFAGKLIHEQERHKLDQRESAWLSATMYAAGSDTVSFTLSWFMLAMVIYPEAQLRAQAELDAIVGRSRMPTFSDIEHLPVLQATVRELLRWWPVAPVGLPHESNEDQWYEGYFIPKGTMCMANIWAMNRDPDVYGADAEHFNPSRHLDHNGQLTSAINDTKDGHVSYGFGKRICVGRHAANNLLLICIACVLWATRIEPQKDDQGRPIIPEAGQSANKGLVIHPIPFKCSLTHRFPEVESILAQTKELHDQ